MTTRAERIRAILEAQDKPKENKSQQSFGAVYPFWNLEHGTNSVVRFLPDGDTSNALPWIESQQINLTFSGVTSSYIGRKVRYESRLDPLIALNDYLIRGETYYFRVTQYNLETAEEYTPREYSNIIYT